MTESITQALTAAAALGCAMNAGLFFIFSNTVMDALGRLPGGQGIAAMQSINRVILNPLFFVLFLGTAVLCAVVVALFFFQWDRASALWQLLGAASYLIGTLVVTAARNVPMNNALDGADAGSEAARTLWADYLRRWVFWNHVRTVACTAGAMAFLVAMALR